jgi:hypothetical protein
MATIIRGKDVQFITFPRTIQPDELSIRIVDVFKKHLVEISTVELKKGLKSDKVHEVLSEDLKAIGFEVENGKTPEKKIKRPVFFGENGKTVVSYEVDAYHRGKRFGLEVEAGRAWKGNAVYRDLIINLLLIDVDHLVLAVPLTYKYKSKKKNLINPDYTYAKNLIDNLYSQTRFKLPYNLTLIGY